MFWSINRYVVFFLFPKNKKQPLTWNCIVISLLLIFPIQSLFRWTFYQSLFLYCFIIGNSTTVTRRTTQAITTTHRTTPAALGTTIVVTSDPCQDLERCVEYGGDVCTAYAAWSKINCRRHCKFCQRNFFVHFHHIVKAAQLSRFKRRYYFFNRPPRVVEK